MSSSIRAVSKLRAIRTGRFDEIAIGRNPGELFFGGLLILALFIVPPAVLVVLAIAGIGAISPVAAGAVFAISLLAAALATAFYLRNETSSPFRTVSHFMQHAIGQNHARAYLLVVDADKDDSPRHFDGKDYSFSNIERFRDYWNQVRSHGGGWGKIELHRGHRVSMLDKDLAQVEFAFCDSNGKRGDTHTKLAVRIGNEWRIFNGEWSGPEEKDAGWVFQAATTPPIDEAQPVKSEVGLETSRK